MARRAHLQRAAARAVAAQLKALRALPQWQERVAAGAIRCPHHWLTAAERAEIEARRQRINRLRALRQARRAPAPKPAEIRRCILWRGVVPLLQIGIRYGARGAVRYAPGAPAPKWLQIWSQARDTRRAAAELWLSEHCRRLGGLELHRNIAAHKWTLKDPETFVEYAYSRRPSRAELVAARLAMGREEPFTRKPGPTLGA
jgi:hypothetical protein